MTRDRAGAEGGLSARIARGASLSLAGNLGARILGMASLAVLGRLLAPADFGILATAMILIALSDALANRQFDLVLIRLPEPDETHFRTAFTLSMIWGLVAGGAIFLAAGPVAALMDEPAVAPALRWLSLAPVLDGFRNPRFVEFQRGLSFLPDVLLNFVAKAVQALVAILLAVILRNYWAMVAAYLAFALTRLAASYAARPQRPGLSLAHWREFLSFGGWLSGTGFLTFLLQKSDIALISATLGAATVGLYNLGTEITQMASYYLALPMARMVYPGLAAVASDPPRLRRAFYRAQEVLMGAMLPLGVGVALLARETILVLVGPKWLAAIPVLEVLGPVLATSLLVLNIQSLLMVRGDTRSMFQRNLVVALVQIPLLLLGLWLLGLAGALLARATAALLQAGLTLRIAPRVTGDGMLAPLLAARRSFAAAAAMAAGVLLLGLVLPEPAGTLEALLTGSAKAALGALLYIGTHLGLWSLAGRPEGFETLVLGILRRLLLRGARNPQG